MKLYAECQCMFAKAKNVWSVLVTSWLSFRNLDRVLKFLIMTVNTTIILALC